MTLTSDRPAVLAPRSPEELVDVSALFRDASDEDRRPAWTTVSSDCACGGLIFAPDMDGMIAAATLVHAKTTLHLLWRRRMGIR